MERRNQTGAQRAASRFMLPLEFYLGVMSFAWGISAVRGYTIENRLLEAGEHTAWIMILCGVGMCQFGVGAWEWVTGRQWPLCRIWRVARCRAWSAFFAAAAWMYVCKLVFDDGVFSTSSILALVAPLTILSESWVFFENIKVRVAADETIHSPTLQFYR